MHHSCRWFVLALAVLLSACAGITPAPAVRPDTSHADALALGGDPRAAAFEYKRIADAAAPPYRAELLVRAAQLFYEAGETETADSIVGVINGPDVPPARQLAYRILAADLAVRRGQPQAALGHLAPADQLGGSVEEQIRVHQLRASALEQTGLYTDSVRELMVRELLLADPDDILQNQRAIWAVLEQIPTAELDTILLAPPPDVFTGWIELARAERGLVDKPVGRMSSLANWRVRHPDHPATRHLLARQGIPELSGAPTHIALLLPETGQLGPVGQAVRDGFMAAFYEDAGTSKMPRITAYDTNDTRGIRYVYDAAVAGGADFAVGPLAKTALEELLATGPLSVPTLVLNRTETETPAPILFQFGLAPEDDARAAAQRAREDGHEQVAAIVPAGAWGDRVAAAFRERWEELGGQVVAEQRFTGDTLAQAVSLMLNVEQSENRMQRLARQLGEKPQFEPRRRQDMSAIFMTAFPREARQIRPLLSFYYAGQVPIYATSHSFSGVPNSSLDQDMNGVRFCDLPWVIAPTPRDVELRGQLSELWPTAMDRYQRLFALGIDAYDLIPHLQRLALLPDEAYAGRTGRLRLDERGRIERDLPWAEIVEGVPQPMDVAAETADEAAPPE